MKEINLNCEKNIQLIKNKQKDLYRQCEFHFNKILDKFIFLTNECKSSLELDEDWREMLQNNNFSNNSESIKEKFEFIKKIDNNDLLTIGNNILKGIQEIQGLINQKIQTGLNTFTVQVKDFDEFFLDIEQNEFDYDYNLKESLQNIIDSANFNNQHSNKFPSSNNLESPKELLLNNSNSGNWQNKNFYNDSEIEISYDNGDIENVYSQQTSIEGHSPNYQENNMYHSNYYPRSQSKNDLYASHNDNNYYPNIKKSTNSISKKQSSLRKKKQRTVSRSNNNLFR